MGRLFSLKACVGVAVAAAGWLMWKAHSARSAAFTAAALAGAPALAEADEVRTFAVTVDGKPGGTYTITTAAAADGTETITVAAEVKVKLALYTYVYQLNSAEVWKNGQLVSLDAKSNDDGKKRTVSAVAGDRGLTVTVNRESRKTGADLITATGVRAPAADKARDAVLFDAEDGSETAVRVDPLGACKVTLNGQVVEGTRFKLTGKDVAAEWWFDKTGRAIRQEMKWDGRKVVMELTAIR
ncbi:DUF6134 family protein [Frigoriglobus tundricola]|uniref:DUF3108 domain-containing protein n=1 Tax=Frigoriglobus tundricola TaxID=2774151 RepID=A0A6M5YYQ9_9BACT|nr:DUF6134 family protein [Frigoriglobus tundricola]QJW99267.1 hypothetical protein FTUN_6869 [Frigoriglobus tundricola]